MVRTLDNYSETFTSGFSYCRYLNRFCIKIWGHNPLQKTSNLLSAGTKRTASQRDSLDDIDAPERDGPDVKWTAAGSHLDAALDILAGDEAEELANRSNIKKSTMPKAMRVGPQRSTTTIRTVTIVDYQPDVCKDYKGKLLFCAQFVIGNWSIRLV